MSKQVNSITPKGSMGWQVVHVVNGEKMTRDELMARYSNELEKATVKMMNIFAAAYGAEVTLKANGEV